jgi:acetyl esterase/lipase
MMEVFVSEYAVFWGLSMFGASVFIVKLLHRYKNNVLKNIILILGIIVFIIFFLPVFSVPSMIKNAGAAYREAFGGDSAVVTQNGFMKPPFSLQDYFFGKRTGGYIVEENVVYYEGADGLRLHFDVYMPEAPRRETGGSSVLIRIHGGAWTMGDKGFSNYSATNKHFVNLGYVVFDIQYGINNQNPSFANNAVPASVKGNFNIDDMVRHIGIFTSYLADHASQYGADMDSVFISGASAGGQLAIAAALGITSGRYTDILDSRLNVRGLIPFYPANGLSPQVGIGGDQDLVDPSALVDYNSRPCLIYHGAHDGIVPPKTASDFLLAYKEKSAGPCALIWMNFSGHGSDFYTPGYYNQIFMYYMERFMHRYK